MDCCIFFFLCLNSTVMFSCLPIRKRSSECNSMQFHIQINKPLYEGTTGSILCVPNFEVHSPLTVSWYDSNGCRLQNDSLILKNVECGEYKVHIIDVDENTFESDFVVCPVDRDAIVVTEYIISNASTPHARDGEVEVKGFGLEKRKILWNIGVTTDGTKLKDIPQGVYFAIGVAEGKGNDTINVHLCQPAFISFES